MNSDAKSEAAAAETIEAILRLEKQNEKALALHHRIFHAIGGFVGTVQFIILQVAGVALWVTVNVALKERAFDEYPFVFLATILGLETVLLTSCVLIRQNLIDKSLERRDHLELQINLLAERESTRALRILQRIAERLGAANIDDFKHDELTRETSVHEIAADLTKRQQQQENEKS